MVILQALSQRALWINSVLYSSDGSQLLRLIIPTQSRYQGSPQQVLRALTSLGGEEGYDIDCRGAERLKVIGIHIQRLNMPPQPAMQRPETLFIGLALPTYQENCGQTRILALALTSENPTLCEFWWAPCREERPAALWSRANMVTGSGSSCTTGQAQRVGYPQVRWGWPAAVRKQGTLR